MKEDICFTHYVHFWRRLRDELFYSTITLSVMLYDNRDHPLDTRDMHERRHHKTRRYHEKLEKHSAHAQRPENYISFAWMYLRPHTTLGELRRHLVTADVRCVDEKDLELYKSLEDRCAGRQAGDSLTLEEVRLRVLVLGYWSTDSTLGWHQSSGESLPLVRDMVSDTSMKELEGS